MVLVAPYFDAVDFPEYGVLNIGLLEPRADRRLIEILAQVNRNTPLRADRIFIYEDAPAAGFAMHFALAHPQFLAGIFIADPVTTFSFAEDAAFPYGLQPNPLASDLRAPSLGLFLRLPVELLASAGISQEQRELYTAFYRQASAVAEELGTLTGLRIANTEEADEGKDVFPETAQRFIEETLDQAQ